MLHTIERAIDFYLHQPEIWHKLQMRGMSGDYSWDQSAEKYMVIYQGLFREKAVRAETPEEPNPVVVNI